MFVLSVWIFKTGERYKVKGKRVTFTITGCIIIAVLLLLCECKNSLLFHPVKSIRETPAEINLSYETVFIRTKDKEKLHAWWIPVKQSRGTVLFCHGNAGNISHRLESIQIFHSLKLDVFIFDYRGYGKSTGEPSEEGTYLDAAAARDYLLSQKKIPHGKIIVFGRSLGGAVATRFASQTTPVMLILESTFSSAYDVGKFHKPGLPVGLIIGDTYNSAEYIAKVSCPVLIIHSTEDEMIPYKLAQKLFSHAKEPKEFVTIHGSHNGGFIDSRKTYVPALEKFITRHLK
ncbi:MAG: alpha/beta hydrolase [bacterium]|nr:alpha/beta hydrolase [bacterium]